MVKFNEIGQQLLIYLKDLNNFAEQFNIQDLLTGKSIDHVAIKAKDRAEYEEYLKEYAPYCERLTYEKVNNRDLATAELSGHFEANNFGQVSTVEIMEPRPGVSVTTNDMIDHIELLVENLELIKQALVDKDVEFEEQSNPAHKTVVIVINQQGQEVKFTDRPLLDIVNSPSGTRVTVIHK